MTIEQPPVSTTIYASNPSDQAVASNTTPQNSVLSLTLDANSSYEFEIYAPFSLGGIACGYKFSLSGPSSPANVIYSPRVTTAIAGTASTAIQSALGTNIAAALASASNHTLTCNGVITTTEGGALTLQFAQNVSDLGAITLKRGAFIKCRKI